MSYCIYVHLLRLPTTWSFLYANDAGFCARSHSSLAQTFPMTMKTVEARLVLSIRAPPKRFADTHTHTWNWASCELAESGNKCKTSWARTQYSSFSACERIAPSAQNVYVNGIFVACTQTHTNSRHSKPTFISLCLMILSCFLCVWMLYILCIHNSTSATNLLPAKL